jgi:hypothetical protein
MMLTPFLLALLGTTIAACPNTAQYDSARLPPDCENQGFRLLLHTILVLVKSRRGEISTHINTASII